MDHRISAPSTVSSRPSTSRLTVGRFDRAVRLRGRPDPGPVRPLCCELDPAGRFGAQQRRVLVSQAADSPVGDDPPPRPGAMVDRACRLALARGGRGQIGRGATHPTTSPLGGRLSGGRMSGNHGASRADGLVAPAPARA
jgi:hypothetical protein